jgi:hypothetical protein
MNLPPDPLTEMEAKLAGEGPMARLNDLEVYRVLISLAERTGVLSQRCWSVATGTALATTSRLLRALASALYRVRIED